MVHDMMRKTSYLPITALLLGVVLLASGWTPAFGDSAEASKPLQDARTSAAQLRGDSVQMESSTRSELSWESHAHQIDVIKEHINRTGKIAADLHNARDGAEPWQQDAIDRITPLLQEMASNAESIIDHLNDRKQTWHPEYQGYLKSNADLATDLSKLIGDYVDYGQAKSRTEKLGQKVGF